MTRGPHEGEEEEQDEQDRRDEPLEELLAYIYESRGFDFRGYKRPSLTRRIQRRMQAVGIESYRAYMDVLQANPGEFADLFDTILINVTAFLRDAEAWARLDRAVIRRLAGARSEDEQIRVWSAGCATGEEAYSLAVLLAEALGDARCKDTVKIYATDVDLDALTMARHGRYRAPAVISAFGEERARRFFGPEDGDLVFDPELRRCLIFGRHDLIQDAPISKIDLLVCRNTLMYFTTESQREVLTKLHFALNPSGALFLGKSEALVARLDIFEPLDAQRRIFRKGGDHPSAPTPRKGPRRGGPRTPEEPIGRSDLGEHSPIPQLIVSPRGVVLAANRPARRQFSLDATDLGEPMSDDLLTISVPELRNVVDQVLGERKTVTISGVRPSGSSSSLSFDVTVSPIEGEDAVVLTFVDVTRYQTVGEDLLRAQAALESAYEELQSTVEELETTNEEMQSTNEELETTNEELHSTNEELETTNEELHSTNEELETMNEELVTRGNQISALNSFLESILSSLKSAVIVLGTDMRIRAWNRHAEDLWGLRASEVYEKHFLNIDIGFPVDTLAPHVRACLAGREEEAQITQRAVNRRGRTVECTVTITRLVTDDTLQGVILVMDAAPEGPSATG